MQKLSGEQVSIPDKAPEQNVPIPEKDAMIDLEEGSVSTANSIISTTSSSQDNVNEKKVLTNTLPYYFIICSRGVHGPPENFQARAVRNFSRPGPARFPKNQARARPVQKM